MPTIDHTHDPRASSWIESADGHAQFPVQNLPFGVFSPGGELPRIGVAIGDCILDLKAASELGHLPASLAADLGEPSLNSLLARAPEELRNLRHALFAMLTTVLWRTRLQPSLHKAADCELHLPFVIGDYTDFYVGIHHARNIGRQFRPDNPLLPNYQWVPIGYHGRASSIRPSGTPVVRPKGQRKPPDAEVPVFGPSTRLDYELELGVWIGHGNALGDRIPIAEAWDHIAGFCLLNDWSARDLQAWEYQPLGPFLAKNFQSTVSPWVVTADAMAPFRRAQPPRPEGDPRPLPHLWDDKDQASGALAIELEVHILTERMRAEGLPPHRLSHGPASSMYWSIAQIIAHHTSNGCNLNSGDLLGTGTISAATSDGFGSMTELTKGGAEPLVLPNGEERGFLADGDEVFLSAIARAEGYAPIGFGTCTGRVLPAR